MKITTNKPKNIHVLFFFYKKNFYKKLSLKNLKKILTKSLVSNVRAAVFKSADFSQTSLKTTKLCKF